MNDENLAKLLAAHSSVLTSSLDTIVASFYHGLDLEPHSHEVLAILSAEERHRLHESQEKHLRLLIDPDLALEERKATAERAGDMHAIIGVPASSLVNAFGLYSREISQSILSLSCSLVERSALLHIINRRLQEDLQWQMDRMDVHQAQIDRVEQRLMLFCQNPQPWADIIRGILDIFLEIPGVSGGGFTRQGARREYVAEFIGGDYENFWKVIQKYDPGSELSGMQRCFIRASQEKQPFKVPNFSQHEYPALRLAAAESGVRSAISIPITESAGHALPVLCLISPYPNTFNAAPLSRIIQGISVQLGEAYRRVNDMQAESSGISFMERRFYRSLLAEGGLVMFYQPIIDLVSGAVIKVEALARLRLPDGEILSPSQFLPWFGQNELAELFSRGLTQSLKQLSAWDRDGLRLRLNVNLPPQILVHPECPNWVTGALQDSGIEPSRLHLELLETQAPTDQAQRDRAIAKLAEIGVNLDMDDLGSGYSSLQRLHLMPFAGIKVDGGIMKGCLDGSPKALGIANAITSLGRDLGLSVVIEGLENPGLIEVAAILGAHKGQGYEIARPMLAADLVPWVSRWQWAVDPLLPQTALGAWARFWKWRRQTPWLKNGAHNLAGCGVGHFVRAQGLVGGELDRAHQAMHQAMANADYPAAKQHFNDIETHLISLIR